jgi:hypothetical protein
MLPFGFDARLRGCRSGLERDWRSKRPRKGVHNVHTFAAGLGRTGFGLGPEPLCRQAVV